MRRIALVACLSLTLFSSAACTDAGAVLVILQNQIPEVGCVVSGSPGQTFRSRGYADTTSPGGYLFTPVVQNLAVGSRNDPSQHRVAVQGADVEISFPEGFSGDTIRDTQFTTQFSGPIEPDGGTTGFAFEVLTRNFLQDVEGSGQLAADGTNFVTVVARISVFGEMDGSTVESEQFDYPIDICVGCLKQDLGACEALPPGFSASQGYECQPLLQDALLQCCTTSTGIELCPATSVSGG